MFNFYDFARSTYPIISDQDVGLYSALPVVSYGKKQVG